MNVQPIALVRRFHYLYAIRGGLRLSLDRLLQFTDELRGKCLATIFYPMKLPTHSGAPYCAASRTRC